MEHQYIGFLAQIDPLKHKQEDRDYGKGSYRQLKELASAGDSDVDGPEDVDHVHRILDGSPEPYDGQGADGSQSYHQISLETHDDGCDKERQDCQSDIERLAVKSPVGYQPVDSLLQEAENHHHEKDRYYRGFGQGRVIVALKYIIKELLKKIHVYLCLS